MGSCENEGLGGVSIWHPKGAVFLHPPLGVYDTFPKIRKYMCGLTHVIMFLSHVNILL